MNNLIKISIIIITMAGIFTSCTKEEGDKTEPVITIVSPANNATHTSGDNLHIHVDIEDNDEIHEIEAYLITTHDGHSDTVWTSKEHPDAPTFTIEGEYTIGTVMHTDFSLQVYVTDHSDNSSMASTGFHVPE